MYEMSRGIRRNLIRIQRAQKSNNLKQKILVVRPRSRSEPTFPGFSAVQVRMTSKVSCLEDSMPGFEFGLHEQIDMPQSELHAMKADCI